MDRKCKEEEEGKKENETGGDGEKELQHDRGRATERKQKLHYSLPVNFCTHVLTNNTSTSCLRVPNMIS